MIWLGLLLVVNICNAGDNLNIRHVMLSASLQVLTHEGDRSSVSHKLKQSTPAILPIVLKSAEAEQKYRAGKINMPKTKQATHHQHQPRKKH